MSARDPELVAAFARLRDRLNRGVAGDTPAEDADVRVVLAAAEGFLARRGIPCDAGYRKALEAGATCVGCVCWKGRQP